MTTEQEIAEAIVQFLAIRKDRIAIVSGLLSMGEERPGGVLSVELNGALYVVSVEVAKMSRAETSRPPSKRS